MSVEWIVIRGSGVVAFVMLAASTIWGLMLATKVLGSWVKAKPLTWFHESLAVGALLATAVHMITLSIHEYVDFTWGDILIPGRSGWRPSAVSFGIVAFYGAFVLSVSFYFKRFVGQRAWRAIHFGSYGVFLAATLHGILSGTDSSEPWMVGVYVGALVASVLLLAIRFAQQYASAPARGQRGRPTVGSDEKPEVNPASAEA